MAEIVLEFKPRVSVEIGVFGGRSLLALALAHQEAQRGIVYGIDPWTAEAALDGVEEKENLDWWARVDYESVYRSCLEAILEFRVESFCTVLRTIAIKAVGIFDAIDLLHIDGNHSEKASVQDVMSYLPKVVQGGHVFFDDIDWFSTRRAVEIVEERCEKVKFVEAVQGSSAWALYRKR